MKYVIRLPKPRKIINAVDPYRIISVRVRNNICFFLHNKMVKVCSVLKKKLIKRNEFITLFDYIII